MTLRLLGIDRDAVLEEVVDRLLHDRLSSADFDRVVQLFWDGGRFVQGYGHIADVAHTIRTRASATHRALYESTPNAVRFMYTNVFGVPGIPGAVHLDAPGEAVDSPLVRDMNRPAHVHSDARILIITAARATFLVHHRLGQTDYVVEAPVAANDVIFMPAEIAHTFDAGPTGFSLLSAMSRFVAPDADEFARPAVELGLDFDALPRLEYAEYLSLGGVDARVAT